MKFIIPIALALITSACATTEKHDQKLQAWIGKTKNQLLADKGKPQETRPDKGGKSILIYEKKEVRIDINRSASMTDENPELVSSKGRATYFAANERALQCTSAFLISSAGIIEQVKSGGNNCRSY